MSRRTEILKKLVAEYERGSEAVSVGVWQKRPYTAARVRVALAETPVMWALGFAKVRYPDEWDAERGIDFAVRKALGEVARRLAEQERGE